MTVLNGDWVRESQYFLLVTESEQNFVTESEQNFVTESERNFVTESERNFVTKKPEKEAQPFKFTLHKLHQVLIRAYD